MLPATLHGCITFIDALSANDVWAFGQNLNRKFQLSGFALVLKGSRWSVAKWFGTRITKSSALVGAVVLGRANVWMFWQGDLVEHFDGTGWHRSKIALPFPVQALQAAGADSDGGIWVLTNEFYVMRLQVTAQGDSWKAMILPGAKANDDLVAIYAQTPQSVWATGGGQHFVRGHWVWVPLIEHWFGGKWHRVPVRPGVTVGSVTRDGSGGLWLATQSGAGTIPPLVHYTSGHLASVRVAAGSGKNITVLALSSIPGSRSAWGVGYLSHKAVDLGGVLLKYGR